MIPSVSASTLATATLLSAPLAAQEPLGTSAASDLPTTIVTARKITEDLDDVPISVTSFSAEDFEGLGASSVRELGLLVPNVNLTEFSSRRLSFPYVRGIGSGQGEPAVATYIDGVPQLTTGSTNLPLLNVDSVEFLRGPQGTLYGRNSLGGVILIKTTPPGEEAGSFGNITVGDYNHLMVGGGWSGALGEDLLGSFEAQHSARDGYTENTVTGDDVDYRDAWFARGRVLVKPSDDSELLIGVHTESARDGGFVLSSLDGLRENPHQISQDFQGVAERDLTAPSVTYSQRGEGIDFTSISAYTDFDVLETSDFDFSPFDLTRRRTTEDQQFFYQELRLNSSEGVDVDLGQDRSLRWLVGLSGFVADSDRGATNEFRSNLDLDGDMVPDILAGTTSTDTGEFQDQAYSLFGQASLLAGDFEFTGGVRFDHESKEVDRLNTDVIPGFGSFESGGTEDEDYSELVPSGSVGWHADDETLVYLSASKGFKAGGFNLDAPAGSGLAYDPETSFSYEAGVKRSFGDGDVRVRAAAFQIDWEDMQLSLFDETVGGYVDNVAESQSVGMELEFEADLNDSLTLFGGAGALDTEITEFAGGINEGNDLPFAPSETWSFGAQFTAPGPREELRWFAQGELAGVGDFQYDVGNNESESYELVNLRAGIQHQDWRLSLWVKNLLDEEYVPVAFQSNPADVNSFVGESGAPRTLGFSLRFSF